MLGGLCGHHHPAGGVDDGFSFIDADGGGLS